jgi:hypothetical protein
MTRLLYDIEDYLEDTAGGQSLPAWMRPFILAVGRTTGEVADIVARRFRR